MNNESHSSSVFGIIVQLSVLSSGLLIYVYFNATRKVPHKFKIQSHPSASDIVDYEKIVGKPRQDVNWCLQK